MCTHETGGEGKVAIIIINNGNNRIAKMAQLVKAHVAKSQDLSATPGAHTVEEKNCPLQAVVPWHMNMHSHFLSLSSLSLQINKIQAFC